METKDLANTLYAYLKEHCIGKETSTWDLVQKVAIQLTEDELWEVHDALRSVVEVENEYEMYLGHYADEIVGLPYYIPFKFRLRKN